VIGLDRVPPSVSYASVGPTGGRAHGRRAPFPVPARPAPSGVCWSSG